MGKEDIDRMTYAEFARRFSVGEPQEAGHRFYLAPNETRFSDVIDRVKAEAGGVPLHYMGVIGGVDMDFHYISALDPEHSFLFDLAREPVHYLGLRLRAFEDAADVGEYFMNLAAVAKADRKGFIKADSMEMFLRLLRWYKTEPGAITSQGSGFMRALGYKNLTPDIVRTFFDAGFRKEAAMACVRYFGRLQSLTREGDDQLSNCWQHHNFRRVQKAALEGRVRAFNADLLCGFGRTAELLRVDYDIRNLVLYISNIPDALWLQLAHDIRAKDSKVGDAEFEKVVHEAVNDTLDATLGPLAERVERLWVIASHHEENRIIGTKRP
jgi:hypothetical protein